MSSDAKSQPSCRFIRAYVGRCGSLYVGPSGMCEKHATTACSSCGVPATRECAHAGQFVCGSPLCDDCGEATSEQGYHGHARMPGRGRGALNLVFTGPPDALVFAEAEDKAGKSVRVGRWYREGDLTILAIDTLVPS